MKTRITTTPRQCLKFEGFIFLPKSNANIKDLRYFASRTPGTLILYDEFGRKLWLRDFAFDNLGEALAKIENTRQKMVYKRTKGLL